MLSSEPTTAASISTFVLSSERNEEALRNKNSEYNRYVVLIILVVKNQLPLVLTLMVVHYTTISSKSVSSFTACQAFQLADKDSLPLTLGSSAGKVAGLNDPF
jgi:hypothetical protein